MKSKGGFITMLVLATCFLLLQSPSTPTAKADGVVQEKINTYWYIVVGVYDDCIGEWIIIEGKWHVTLHSFTDPGGKQHFRIMLNAQGLKGIGEVTGTVWNANCPYIESEIASPDPDGHYVYNMSNNSIFTTRGKGNNGMWQWKAHLTVNANGEVTADIYTDSFKCY
ncbi:MAG TPA: hypothetical protein PKI62_14290 [bacterium]|nr:hypothetical protein [bacterium]HPR89136.1 hypothetical protein [bacterium]